MRLASAIAFVLATVLGAMQCHALMWVALVISDAGYQNAHVLPNPINDARDVAELRMVIAADHEAAAPLSAAEERVLMPKDSFKECAQCPGMVVVPAGSFTMGSPDSEEGRIEEEGPQHRVTFGKAFGVGRFAVTFEEWDACVADGGCNGYKPSDEGWGRGRRPAINVSWDDARAYVGWLSRKTGRTYRLLSEAEREYVTPAGTTTPFWWGTSISTQQANYNGNYTYGTEAKGVSRGKPCRSIHSNPIRGGSTRFMAMCGNGRKTVGTTATLERPRMARLGHPADVVTVSFAAVPGTSIRGSSARPSASGTPPTAGKTSLGSVPGGRLTLESPTATRR